MTKRDTFDLVIKAFGIWLMAMFVRTIPMTVIQFTVDTSEFIANRPAYLALNVTHSLLYFLVASLFLLKGHTIASLLVRTNPQEANAGAEEPAYARLWFWITIIGLYHFLSSASALFGQLLRLTFDYSEYTTISLSSRDLWPSVFMLSFSLVFIFKSKAIESFILRKSNKGTQSHSGDRVPAPPDA
ncbi:MAG: hypothetical protein R6V03_03955 [Kiritimatiellia bacterium]